MTQTKSYLSSVGQLISYYQQQLIIYLKKSTHEQLNTFKNNFDIHYKKIQQIQINKSIEKDKISVICQNFMSYLNMQVRVNNSKTSQSERYVMRSSLRSQDGHRMRFTGGLKKNYQVNNNRQQELISQTQQLQEIIKSYKIQQGVEPRMRMKWKSFDRSAFNQQKNQDNNNTTTARNQQNNEQNHTTIGDNNINLLSYTIPQIQNSIRRLSVYSTSRGSRGAKSPDRLFDNYRTVDTRVNNRKKYVNRLI